MRTEWLGTMHGHSSLLVVLLLAACGGGGGGGGTAPLVYSGNMNPAAVTTTNASKLTANVMGGSDAASVIAGVSAQSSNAAPAPGGGLADVSRRLSRDFRDIAVRLKPMSSTPQAAVTQIDDTQPCDSGSGTVRVTGPIDDMTGTGTLTVTFTNCLSAGVTLNGQATMRIDAFDVVLLVITDSTISFARLTLRATGLSVDAGGSLRIQLVIATNTETVTASLVSLDNSTGETGKTENLVSVSVFDDIAAPTSFTENLSGRVFDQVHGYVDITTPTLLVFDALDQLFPTSGQMVMTGAVAGTGKRAIRATALLAPPAALPATLASLELDLDGDSNYEINARLKWADLSGAVGADLGDSDGDGMHNSWETVNGLNPADLSDGAGDKDNDVSTNLSEYLAGTDPSDPFSHP